MVNDDSPDAVPRKGSLLSFSDERASTRDAEGGAPRDRPGRSLLGLAPASPPEPPPLADRLKAASRAAASGQGGGSAPPAADPGLAARLKERLSGFRARSPERQPFPPAPRAAPAQAAATPVTPRIEPSARPSDSRRREDGNPYWRPLIDPVKVVSGVLASTRLIVAATILGGVLGVLIALATPKMYESTTEVLVDPRNLNIVEREITQAGLPSDATLAIVENQVRVMTSGTVIDKVVERLNLADDPEFNGGGGGFSIRGLIADIRSLLRPIDVGEGGVDVEQAMAVGNLYDALNVERGSKTFVISISATTRDADKSALIANTLVTVFLETYGELQSGTAVRATEELTGRLDTLRADVEAAERRVEAFKQENEIIDPQGRLITDDEIVKLNDQLAVARARTIELNARAQSTRAIDVDQVIEGTLPEEAASGLMTELRSQYASLKQESDRVSTRLGPRHPERIAIEAQVTGAIEQIQNELRRINASIQVDLRRAVQLEQDLASRLAQLKVRKGDIGNELVTLRELERDASSKRAVYEAFLLRARETGEQQSLNTANLSVISTAHPALLPTGPSRSMIAIAGAFLGFAAGVAGGAGMGAWRSFRDRREDEAGEDDRPMIAPRAARPQPKPQPRTTEQAAAPPLSVAKEPDKDMMHLVQSDDRERRHPAQPGMPYPAYGGPAQYPGYAAPEHHAPVGYPPASWPQPPQAWQPAHPSATPPQGWRQPAWPSAPPSFAAPAWPQQPPAQQSSPPWQQAHYPWPQPAPQGWQGQPGPSWPQQQPAPEPHAYAPPQSWPSQAPAGYAYPPAQPQAQYPAPHPQPQQPPALSLVETERASAAAERAETRDTRNAIDEIRDSLREFRDAIRDLTESRKSRRYF